MSYELKAYIFRPDGNNLDLKFQILFPSFEEVIEFISRCSMFDYDRVTVLPIDFKKEI